MRLARESEPTENASENPSTKLEGAKRLSNPKGSEGAKQPRMRVQSTRSKGTKHEGSKRPSNPAGLRGSKATGKASVKHEAGGSEATENASAKPEGVNRPSSIMGNFFYDDGGAAQKSASFDVPERAQRM